MTARRASVGAGTRTPLPPVPLRCAIVYDFDGTLAEGNIQEHTFLPAQGRSTDDFWKKVKAEAKKSDSDEILVYMREMLQAAREANHPLTRQELKAHGMKTPLFPGVDSWFDRIDAHAIGLGLNIEHYVVSSGIREMIAGCSIADKFMHIFASSFLFDGEGQAVWPGVAINYTTKTQFLFRINKGVMNNWDNEKVNTWVPMKNRPIPFERIIFIGDGDTDIPSMKMVRLQGGHSIAVFDEKRFKQLGGEAQSKLYKLISEDRVHFVAPANYSDGSQLDITIKGILGRMLDA